MYSVQDTGESMRFEMTSHVHLLDRLARDARNFIERSAAGANDAGLIMTLRELVLNAIEHGNKNNEHKAVAGELRNLAADRFRLRVSDEGSGFDYHSLRLYPAPTPDQTRNRGYAVIHAYADEIRFENDGAAVTAFCTLPRETTFETVDGKDLNTVVPSGDLTAGAAERFRSILVDWIQNGQTKLVLDMRNVRDIDSICLSVLAGFGRIYTQYAGRKQFEIRGVDGNVMNCLTLTQMHRLFTLVPADSWSR